MEGNGWKKSIGKVRKKSQKKMRGGIRKKMADMTQ
jgi:hypothetical protein